MEAIQIGRLIRSLYLNTNAPWSPQSGSPQPYCKRNDNSVLRFHVPCLCGSSCFLIWAAGFWRYGDEVYLHRISFEKEYFGGLTPAEASAKYEEGLEIVRRYLQEIGVDDKYYVRMLKTPSHSSDKLSWSEASADFGFWARPAFQEWLIARCGGFASGTSSPQAKIISDCWIREHKKALHSQTFCPSKIFAGLKSRRFSNVMSDRRLEHALDKNHHERTGDYR
jgi:hypothetical protein